MIGKQYKKGTRTGKKGQKREKGGKKRVGTGAETGFKRKKNGISPNSTIWNGVEQPFFGVPHLSCRFLAVPPRFSSGFHDFGQKREKNRCPKMEERERKERVPFPFLSRSRFFPFLAWHISSPTASWLERVSLKTLAFCSRFNSVWCDAQVIESILTQGAAQRMSADVWQPTPPVHDARVSLACGKSQGRIPLFSQLLDGVRDLFVDFEYATSAVNKCSEPSGIGVSGLRLEPSAETQGQI